MTNDILQHDRNRLLIYTEDRTIKAKLDKMKGVTFFAPYSKTYDPRQFAWSFLADNKKLKMMCKLLGLPYDKKERTPAQRKQDENRRGKTQAEVFVT